MGWIISPVHAAGLSPAHSIWVGSGPAQNGWARSGPVFFLKKIQKYFFGILQFSRVFFMSFWLISSSIFMLLKIQNRILKYPVFVKTSKIQKTLKKKKIVFVHTAKCLKDKKSYCVFYTKKQCFSMHFGFNNQFIKVKRTLAKISKKTTKKIYFVLSFSIRGTILHVIHILDIKSFSNVRIVRFYPIR